MSALDVYRRVLATYRREARPLLALSLLVFVPVGLLKAIPIEIDVNEVGPVEGAALFVAFLVDASLSFVGAIFYSGAVARLVEEEEGMWEQRSLVALVRSLPYARLAAIDVVVTLATAFGLLLFVLPGVLMLTWFSLAAPLAEIEERRVIAALRRSRQLVKRDFWLVLRVVFPIWLAGTLLESGGEALARSVLGEGIPSEWLATTVTLSAYTPVYALATVLLTVGLATERR